MTDAPGARVLVASGGHKEYLTPLQASESIAAGLARWSSSLTLDVAPMADGAEGTIDAILAAQGGKVVSVDTHDPLFRRRTGRMGIGTWDGQKTAIIESAEAAGAALLQPHERQTMVATSYGLGELILAAVAAGCTRVVVGLGGSIVSDGGIGMAQALGFTFLDPHGAAVQGIANPGLNALNLMDIAEIRRDHLKLDPSSIELLVAADVDIPLTGPGGQAHTFGPQKGANQVEIDFLEAGLSHLATVLRTTFGREVDLPLGGASGGIGAGLVGFLDAHLFLGAQLVATMAGLEARVESSDVVVIGEGRLDRTTPLNKAPHFVGQLAHRWGKLVLAIVGEAKEGGYDFYDRLVCCEPLYPPVRPLHPEDILNSLEQIAFQAASELWPRLTRT